MAKKKTPKKLKRLTMMGFDVKITPEGKVKLIEINGSKSGWRGFQRTYEEHPIDDLLLEGITRHERGVYVFEELDYYGIDRLVDLDSSGRIEKKITKTLDPSDYFSGLPTGSIIWNKIPNNSNPQLLDALRRTQDYVVMNHPSIEEVLEEKSRTRDELFDASNELLTTGGILITNGRTRRADKEKQRQLLLKTIRESDDTHYMVKPEGYARGTGIQVVTREELLRPLERGVNPFEIRREDGTPLIQRDGLDKIIEGFAPSKRIRSEITAQEHDGCMRYFVLVEEDTLGNVTAHHLNGYWRLAAKPIDDETASLEERLKANLSIGGIAQRATTKELHTVRDAINRHLPGIYSKLLTAIGEPKKGRKRGTYKSFSRSLRRGPSDSNKKRSKRDIFDYTLDELRNESNTRLREIAIDHKIHVPTTSNLRRSILDYKVSVYIGTSATDVDIRDIKYKFLEDASDICIYNIAKNLGLRDREDFTADELKSRVLKYRSAYWSTRGTKLESILSIERWDQEKVIQTCTDLDLVYAGERVRVQTLRQRILDFKVQSQRIFEPAKAEEMNKSRLESMGLLKLYSIAEEYNIKNRVRLLKGNKRKKKRRMINAIEKAIVEKPKVSVYIVSTDDEATIKDCVESIVNQRVEGGIEICVLDNASSDRTAEIVKGLQVKYNGREGNYRIRLRKNFSRENLGRATSNAIKMCTGDYVMTMDSRYTLNRNGDQSLIAEMVDELGQDKGIVYSFKPKKDSKDPTTINELLTNGGRERLEKDPIYKIPGYIARRELFLALNHYGLTEIEGETRQGVMYDTLLRLDAISSMYQYSSSEMREAYIKHPAGVSTIEKGTKLDCAYARIRAKGVRKKLRGEVRRHIDK